jgi:tetratricopeptide (TPR) repeat protein
MTTVGAPMTDLSSLWDWSDPAESEQAFRLAAQPDSEFDAIEAMTQVARALGLQGRFEDGHAILDSYAGLTGRQGMRVHLERGRLYNSAGNPNQAVAEFLAAVELASESNLSDLHIDALHMLGICAPESDRLDWNTKAIAMAKSSDDPSARKWLGSLLNNTAWTHHDNGDFQAALDLFLQAQDWHSEHGNPGTVHIAKWSVARALRSLGRFEEALAIQNDLAAADPDDDYVKDEIVANLDALGRSR